MTASDPMPLVERLRDTSGRHINGLYDKEAADEIERLTAALEAEKAEVFRLRDALAQAKEAPPGWKWALVPTDLTPEEAEKARERLMSVERGRKVGDLSREIRRRQMGQDAATPPSPAQAAGWRDTPEKS